jgi:hypothetical protein
MNDTMEDNYMPFLKNNIRNNTDIRYLNKLRTEDEEQRIANAILQDRIELKDTPLSRMTGLKTPVTYYKQKIIGKNDYLVNTGTIGSTDPTNQLYIKVYDFIILCQGEFTTQMDPKEIGVDFIGEGTAKFLPKTVQPMIADYFVMTVYNKPMLFKVTNVNKATIEDDSAYEISYQLIEENPDEKLQKLEELVSDIYHFVYSHVGTSFRTLFRNDEYISLCKLDTMYQRLGSLFNEFFYDKDKNTYILVYEQVDKKEDSPYVTPVPDGSGSLITPPYINLSDTWYNAKMYDRMLIEFMVRNKIFDYVDRHIYRVSQLQVDTERWYSKTLFYAIENRTTSRIVFRYLLPSPINRVTIATSLNLYGVTSLEPSVQHTTGTLDLYPQKLISYVMWEAKERSVVDYRLNTYNDMLEFMCETIGLYVNKQDEHIIARLLKIYEYIDTFFDISVKQHMYYVFPVLAYVIRQAMDRLSDPTFSLNVI